MLFEIYCVLTTVLYVWFIMYAIMLCVNNVEINIFNQINVWYFLTVDVDLYYICSLKWKFFNFNDNFLCTMTD